MAPLEKINKSNINTNTGNIKYNLLKPFHVTALFPWKHQKTSFVAFSGGIERNQWYEIGY